MQKIINVLSIASFVISGSIAGAGVYVYANKDALIEGAKEKIQKELTKSIGSSITKDLPTPSLPSKTGLAIPPL
tara:strand:+ start:2774 stop:2995 length:222 start_codon:yes stop_codon:yes gene_type:complete